MIRLIVFLFACSTLFAQTDLLHEADSLFHAAEYERVKLLVLRAERQFDLPDSQRVALDLLGAYSLIMLGREEAAREHFMRVLEVDSMLTLDPVRVSPKFRVVFDDVKAQFLSRRAQNLLPGEPVTGIVKIGARTESHAMNLIVPGSGFLREGKTIRGLSHLLLQGLSAGLWLTQVSQTSDARKKYLAAKSSDDASSLYDDYDSHHRQMWTYGLTSAGIYLLSQFDLALLKKSESVRLSPTPEGVKLSLSF